MISIKDIQRKIQEGKTPTEVVEDSITKLKSSKQYNSTISDMFEAALARAKDLEASPTKGRLYGIPFIAKDNLAIKGTRTTAASNILGTYISPYTATAIKKLEDEGAICIAKANMDSFGHGSSTENSDFASTLNPHDQTKVPGGSSGGSAAVVALGVVPFAIGTDTGGSIRQPASFTGTFGIKPSYGRVSRNGAIAMASSTDTVGVLSSSSQDLSLVLDVMAGKDLKDSTTIEKEESLEISEKPNPTNYKVALIKEFLAESVDQEVRQQVLEAVAKLKASGVQVDEVSIPEVEFALAAYYIIIPAEVSSNLARYDGIRYGYSTKDASNLSQTYEKSRMEGLNHENKRRILIGAYVLSSGYYDAYYKKAQQVRTLLKKAFDDVFSKYDALIGPVAPTTAFNVGESEDPVKMYLGDIMTVGASLIGSPAVSVPVGLGSESKMPVGLQIISKHGDDKKVLNLAQIVEEAIK
jgi:aspartyl-tRNA(Asn)/glutamyl-tRNA(Gln) amidotransferase subunit A